MDSLTNAPTDNVVNTNTPTTTKETTLKLSQSNAYPQLQIIDDTQAFSNQVNDYMRERWHLIDNGFNYNIVAVFGSQSTGKSTLLNSVFGTSFDVMDEKRRAQTTKGIWISRGQGMKVLVMDVEGTDGRERGEDQDFERKSALFSMATAEAIIINQWENMIGLYNGANMGLLKTVFEVNLQLFQQKGKGKTLLFFVIRDFIGNTPLENLTATLTNDLNKLWSGLSKPEGLEDCQITDFFDFAFAALPHKILLPEKFDEGVAALRRRFTDSSDPEYVFKPYYHKMIPADGFSTFLEAIWEKIVTNRDLDLPTQKELLAQYRCDEIANASFNLFMDAIKEFKRPIEAGSVVEDLGPRIHEIRQTYIKSFDKDASRYHEEVYKRKRQEVINKFNSQLHIFYVGQLRNLHRKAVTMFTESLREKLKGEQYDFGSIVLNSKKESQAYFKENAEAITLSDTEWSYEEEANQLDQSLEDIAQTQKRDEMKKLINSLEKHLRDEFSETVTIFLTAAKPDMWRKTLEAYKSATDNAEEKLAKRAGCFNSDDQEMKSSIQNLRMRSWDILCQKIKDETVDHLMILKLRNKLEENFRYDSEGLPRVWKPEDDMDGYFRKAKAQAVQTLPLFSKIDIREADFEPELYFPEEYDFGSTLTVLSNAKQQDLLSRFTREADALFVEAKRSVVATTARIPYWVIVLLIVLGWNEFISILSNPIYLVFTIFAGITSYIVYALNLVGPINRILKGVFNEAVAQINASLTEPKLNPPHLAKPQVEDEIEMTTKN
ncbi:root hair defective 3 GTP-binding protein [Basidiobolus meristosporus CBS 931.73]|uniref:Root hair defective 3 GTP-binding protein n=1 Tax=Basidiobolus meristosporus CBS 931.73 TaxID=1314790 RepID=A0A1Y1XGQ9_9FUNG|nr:root hair defective 3 GTP-binding protein [Basidiobolus meristosporus CBS 931.73]|eukprot:ORX84913.1 root hair defective 3 GTP-binding protein [Basidiobolus meristosporus CBS 931.73]